MRTLYTRAQAQGLKESRITIRGDGDKDTVASESKSKLAYKHKNKMIRNNSNILGLVEVFAPKRENIHA